MKATWIGVCVGILVIGAGTASADEALAKRSGCLKCHSVDMKVIGPAYRDVAMKYRSDPGARQTLIEKVTKGGKGNWTQITGGVPMPPHSNLLNQAEIAKLVDWILSR